MFTLQSIYFEHLLESLADQIFFFEVSKQDSLLTDVSHQPVCVDVTEHNQTFMTSQMVITLAMLQSRYSLLCIICVTSNYFFCSFHSLRMIVYVAEHQILLKNQWHVQQINKQQVLFFLMKDANLKLQFGITTRLESSVQKKTFVGYIELSKVHFESNLWVKYYVVCNRE